MDRRRFLLTCLATVPALTPSVLAADKTRYGGELYLISDDPQDDLPALLREAEAFLPTGSRRAFTFLTPHPLEQRMRTRLAAFGWSPVPDRERANLTLSFSPLFQPARPSFTFVRDGRIWDIRSRGLRSLWDRMGRRSPLSATLTTAGFRPDHGRARGEAAALYHQGRLKERIPLDRTGDRILPASNGRLVVRVSEGRARVLESPCRNKVCSSTPPVSLAGERIICAPNHFLLEIQGPGGLDAVIG